MVAGLLCLLPGLALAEQARFDVYLLGLRAGTLSYAMEQQAGRYAVSGKIRSAGVIGALRHFRMDASTQGRRTDRGFTPELYEERSEENDDKTARSIRYDAAGRPELRSEAKPRDYWVPPAKQAGALDPMTTVYELLRDRRDANPCVLDATIADGARMGQLTSAVDSASDETVTCRGLYERTGGFSRKQLKDGTRFPFTLTYERKGDLWALTRMRISSVHGRAQLVRR